MKNAFAILAIITALALGGCTEARVNRGDFASNFADTAGFNHEVVDAGLFTITAFTHITDPLAPVSVYIEGDGLAWLGRHTPSLDPTPTNPVALRLAVLDPAPNVIYLARPCQYTKMVDPQIACPQKYWMGSRLAPEILDSLNMAIDQLKASHMLAADVDFVGYSGGGGAAVLLAARRSDTHSLRTIAGNIDNKEFVELHNLTPMPESLDPHDVAKKLAAIPQMHFIGGDDDIVPPAIYNSFSAAMGPNNCTHMMVVPGITHDKGWRDAWPRLLKDVKLSCDP